MQHISTSSAGRPLQRKATAAGLWACLASAALLAACSSPVKLDDQVKVESRTGQAVDPNAANKGASTGAAGQSAVKQVDTGANADKPVTLDRVVYFDFDSFVVKDEFRPIIEGHAKQLAANKAKRMMVEGHTDERGGREYNLALGQKRADAVVKAMALVGADAARLEAVSFGKERPANEGHDEAAWAKNRRAELKDR
jgi:peptidoglycan-associated lipoprotein